MGVDEWRWMRRPLRDAAPSRARPDACCACTSAFPARSSPTNPTITVKLNGRVVDQFRTTVTAIRRARLSRRPRAARPAERARALHRAQPSPRRQTGAELGLRLRYLGMGTGVSESALDCDCD